MEQSYNKRINESIIVILLFIIAHLIVMSFIFNLQLETEKQITEKQNKLINESIRNK